MALRTEPRLPLSRDRILHTALDLADESGIESLTMRKLGQALGFEAMSLYNHVANKDDVLDGILDLVLAESELPPLEEDWNAAIRSSAISVHQAFLRHPWACHVRLREAGFSANTTYHAYHVLDAHIFGFSLWQTTHVYTAAQVSDMAAELTRMIPADEHPYLREHAEQHMTGGPHHDVSAFDLGLDFILDGLERMRGSERVP